MPFYGKRRGAYKKRPKSTKKRATNRRGVSAPIKSYVNRVIHKNIENKIEETLSAGNAVQSYAANSSLFVVSCIPYSVILQGLGQGDRIGNQIKTRKCMMSYVLRPAPYDAVANPTVKPQEVLVFFGKVKNSRAQAPINTDFAKLYQAGDTSRAPLSNLLDTIMEVNREWFTVYKVFRHKVGYSQASATGNQGPSGTPIYQYYGNNDFKLNVVKKIDLTKHCPKTVKFNDTTVQNTNDGLWMWMMCVNSDGTVNLGQTPTYCDYKLTYHYEDA